MPDCKQIVVCVSIWSDNHGWWWPYWQEEENWVEVSVNLAEAAASPGLGHVMFIIKYQGHIQQASLVTQPQPNLNVFLLT